MASRSARSIKRSLMASPPDTSATSRLFSRAETDSTFPDYCYVFHEETFRDALTRNCPSS